MDLGFATNKGFMSKRNANKKKKNNFKQVGDLIYDEQLGLTIKKDQGEKGHSAIDSIWKFDGNDRSRTRITAAGT
jgi:hypothetical protein